ncbi:MAG: methyltransferase [Proteobacteria bacterium]|nr:methyltransferase [Pseudomonadota bacterium]
MKHLLTTLLVMLLAVACSPQKTEPQPAEAPQAPQAQQDKQETAQPAQETAPANAEAQAPQAEHHAGMVHDPSNPPVDCPLRKQGLDPTQMKPFEQMEAYIQFLDREDRKIWQKPQEIVDQMQLKGSERVLDLGAGSGYFSFPISQKLTTGRLFAADVEPEMIRHIHHHAMLKGIQNIEVKLIDPQKPEIPENIDIVFMCDVMHHIASPVEWMSGIVNQLPAGAQFHIIEFKQGEIPNGPPESAKIAPEKLLEIAKSSGLELDHEVKDLLPYQIYYIFRKAQ